MKPKATNGYVSVPQRDTFIGNLYLGAVFFIKGKASKFKIVDFDSIPSMVSVQDESGNERLMHKRAPVREIKSF